MKPFPSSILLILFFCAFISCNKDSTTPNQQSNVSISKFSGDNQSGVPGDTLSSPLVVLVLENGNEVYGQWIQFKVIAGDAALSDTLVATNDLGKAEIKVILGNSESNIRIEAKCLDSEEKVEFLLSSKFPGFYNIKGKVVEPSNGNGISDIKINLTGENVNLSSTTDATGNYSFTDIVNGTYTLTPEKSGYSFVPESLEIIVYNKNIVVENFIANFNAFILKIDPSELVISGISIQTDVDVFIENVNGLLTSKFKISFNPSILEVVFIKTSGNGFIFNNAGASVIVVEDSYDNVSGNVIVAVGGVKQGFMGAYGSGKLATISFRSKAAGYGDFVFINDEIMLSKFADNEFGWVKAEVITYNGKVAVENVNQ